MARGDKPRARRLGNRHLSSTRPASAILAGRPGPASREGVLNELFGVMLGWSQQAVRDSALGYWSQEAFIFLLGVGCVVSFLRYRMALVRGTVTLLLVPWLTNAEAVVVAMAGDTGRMPLLAALGSSVAAGFIWWVLSPQGPTAGRNQRSCRRARGSACGYLPTGLPMSASFRRSQPYRRRVVLLSHSSIRTSAS